MEPPNPWTGRFFPYGHRIGVSVFSGKPNENQNKNKKKITTEHIFFSFFHKADGGRERTQGRDEGLARDRTGRHGCHRQGTRIPLKSLNH
jgi:hypothetical protein